jgi:hypothetical protein
MYPIALIANQASNIFCSINLAIKQPGFLAI